MLRVVVCGCENIGEVVFIFLYLLNKRIYLYLEKF